MLRRPPRRPLSRARRPRRPLRRDLASCQSLALDLAIAQGTKGRVGLRDNYHKHIQDEKFRLQESHPDWTKMQVLTAARASCLHKNLANGTKETAMFKFETITAPPC